MRTTTPTPYMLTGTDHGRVFAVRLLLPGARYGRNNALTLDTGDEHGPTVEFYDTTYADDGDESNGGGHGPLGQFVSRYYAATLLGTDGYGTGTGGVCLHGGASDVWTIDARAMDGVRRWLTAMVRAYSIHKGSGTLAHHLARVSAESRA